MNYNEMCRTCLRSGETMSSIFDEEIIPSKHTAADLLAMLTSVQVDEADDFPHNICEICLKEIQQAYLFDLKCRKSEIILHQLRDIRVNLKKLNETPKLNETVSEVAGELESIIKEDFKLEDIMSQIVEEECTRDFQLAFKREPDHSNNFMKDDTNEKELERNIILSNFQIVPEDCNPKFQITLKQESDHNRPIIRNNAVQNELDLNQSPSNFEILDECALENQVICKTEPDKNNLIIKNNENEGELESSGISSNSQITEDECVQDFRVTFKTEPELDLGLYCNDEQLKCSACLIQFQSVDMFRGHIVSDHLEENICKLCNEEFECSQFEHSAKHLPLDYDEHNTIEPNEKFQHGETATGHMKTIHDDKVFGKPGFQCKICSKVFVFRYRLVNHMPTHTGEKPFGCELCPKKFGYSRALIFHRRIMHTNELKSDDKAVSDFQCRICYKVFGLKCLLRNHMRSHNREKPFQCKLCPKKFGNSSTLLYHRRTKHTDELISDDKPVPDFQCTVCYKVFGRKCQVRNHMRTHTGEKPFNCELCPKKFGNSSALLCHRRIKHTDNFISDDKPVPDFQCSVCYQVFGHKWRLRNHMNVHTDEKPLDREKSGNSSALLCHKQTKHTDELLNDNKPISDLQCSVCYKVFGHKWRLRDHMRVHTGEKPLDCEFCPEKFRNSSALLYHRRTKHIDELFSDNKAIADLQCSVCNKVFGQKSLLRDHMRNHTGEKPFDCELCPGKFASNRALLYHKRTKHTDELISNDKSLPDMQCKTY